MNRQPHAKHTHTHFIPHIHIFFIRNQRYCAALLCLVAPQRRTKSTLYICTLYSSTPSTVNELCTNFKLQRHTHTHTDTLFNSWCILIYNILYPKSHGVFVTQTPLDLSFHDPRQRAPHTSYHNNSKERSQKRRPQSAKSSSYYLTLSAQNATVVCS